MKYVVSTVVLLTFAIIFTTSSGVLKADAYPDYETDRNYQEADLYKYGEKGLYGLDKEFLEGIDKEILLNTAINLLKGLDFDALNEELTDGTSGYGGAFVLIVVLFILLVIIGAGFGYS